MEAKEVIIYNEPSTGRIAICTPVGKYDDIHEVAKQALPKDVAYHVVSPDTIPKIGNYLDAVICHDDGKLSINEIHVHNITYNKWRILREPILSRLDVEFIKAMETGNQILITEVVNKKNTLRDITKIELPIKDINDSIEIYINKINSAYPDCLSW